MINLQPGEPNAEGLFAMIEKRGTRQRSGIDYETFLLIENGAVRAKQWGLFPHSPLCVDINEYDVSEASLRELSGTAHLPIEVLERMREGPLEYHAMLWRWLRIHSEGRWPDEAARPAPYIDDCYAPPIEDVLWRASAAAEDKYDTAADDWTPGRRITLRWDLHLPIWQWRDWRSTLFARRGETGTVIDVDADWVPVVELDSGRLLYMNGGLFMRQWFPEPTTSYLNVLCASLQLEPGMRAVVRQSIPCAAPSGAARARMSLTRGDIVTIIDSNLIPTGLFAVADSAGRECTVSFHHERQLFPLYPAGTLLRVVRGGGALDGEVVRIDVVGDIRMLVTLMTGRQVEILHRDMLLFELVKPEPTPERPRALAATPPASITDEEMRSLMETWDLPLSPPPAYPAREAPRRPRLEKTFQDPKRWAEFERLGYGPMMSRAQYKELVARYRRMRVRGRQLHEGYEYNPGRPYEGIGCEEPEHE